jgi:glycosyltransferase involved in cell wall biosynthesis
MSVALSNTRPLRVLHIIDGLGGGGAERLLWDIVRLSDARQVRYSVVTVFPDDGSFVYAERLRAAGAYHQPAANAAEGNAAAATGLASIIGSRLPPSLKRPLKPLRDAAVSLRNRINPTSPLSPSKPEPSIEEKSDSASLQEASNGSSPTAGEQSSAEYDATLQELIMDGVYADAVARISQEYVRFRPDVIHGHTFHGFTLGLFAKLVFKRPLVYFIPALFSQLEDVEMGWLPRQYERFHPWVDRFFTAHRSELLGLGVPASKISPIDGLVDLEAVERVKGEREHHRIEIRRAAGIPDDSLIALSVGRLHSSKGHEYALEALPSLTKAFPNLHWIAIGAGTPSERRALEERARELNVSEHMHLPGFASEPLPFYAAADIYLRTPVYESDNLSSYQAMAMGLPIVGFETGREAELTGKVGNGMLVPLRDAVALSRAAEQILRLPDRGGALGERGAAYCHAHLDSRRFVSMLVAAYKDLHQSPGEQ